MKASPPKEEERGGEVKMESSKTYKNDNKKTTNEKNKHDYSKDLRSRFGEAFLPYTSKLESVEESRILRKRRGKHKKLQLNIPRYTTDKENKTNQFERH